jgi:ectoine hydroxylase-related dioxygenase (phytanoyl-CoA dioxygenase family)
MLLPNASKSGLGWHVDYPYHDIPMDRWPVPLPAYPLGVQVLWLLDDFREDNGGTMFLPGSHLKPQSTSGGFEDIAGQCILNEPAGTVLIAHSAWHHRQTTNVSADSRTALLGNYTPMFVTPKDSMEHAWRHRSASNVDKFLSEKESEMYANLWLGRKRRGNYK